MQVTHNLSMHLSLHLFIPTILLLPTPLTNRSQLPLTSLPWPNYSCNLSSLRSSNHPHSQWLCLYLLHLLNPLDLSVLRVLSRFSNQLGSTSGEEVGLELDLQTRLLKETSNWLRLISALRVAA
jgi:hypothetical protein